MKKKVKHRDRAKQGVRPWVVTIFSFLFIILVGVAAWFQLNIYEQGVLDVYANQQDGYVQLVLEQIRLTELRGGTEAQIEEILATLDASSNRYWTLSRQSSLIFVKDVMETNRYQGFTTASYFQTASAQDFVDQLDSTGVTHSTIQIGSQPYIASGARFTFLGSAYRVCLLTNANTVLDHNAYLTAKINLCTLVLITLCAFLVSIELLSHLGAKYRKLYLGEADASTNLRVQVEKLTDALQKDDLYDSRRTAYTVRALPTIWEKLEGQEIWPLSFLLLQCPGKEEQQRFLEYTQLQMNSKIFRVILDDTHILLLLLRIESLELSAIKENINIPGASLIGERTLTGAPGEPLEAYFNSFLERTLEDEKQTSM